MAPIPNTYTRYDAVGIREDLSDVISRISPEDTPFQSNIGTGPKPGNTFFEWQVDALATPDDDNVQIEGDEFTYQSVTPTTRVGNYCQISRKSVVISDTLEELDKAGRKSEMAREIAKKGKELKLDIETMLLANQGAVAGNSVTPRRTAGMGAWLKTNTDFGAGGADPVYTNVPTSPRTDGTQRDFTETILKSIHQKAYQSGGKPRMLMLGAHNKTVFSTFAGVATKYAPQKLTGQASIIGAADFYVGDFGTIYTVVNLFQRPRDAWLLDPEYLKMRWLRPIRRKKVAPTGDAHKEVLICEYGLEVTNEAAHALAADLTTS